MIVISSIPGDHCNVRCSVEILILVHVAEKRRESPRKLGMSKKVGDVPLRFTRFNWDTELTYSVLYHNLNYRSTTLAFACALFFLCFWHVKRV